MTVKQIRNKLEALACEYHEMGGDWAAASHDLWGIIEAIDADIRERNKRKSDG